MRSPDNGKFIIFLKQVFGATELRRFEADGGGIMHAEVRIDDTVWQVRGPDAPAGARGTVVQAEVLRQLGDINTRIVKVREVMGEIAGASEEQSSGVAQISQAVDFMNDIQHCAGGYGATVYLRTQAMRAAGQYERNAGDVPKWDDFALRPAGVAGAVLAHPIPLTPEGPVEP